MVRIGLLSDTHSHLETSIFEHFKDCDEIWHAGDIGSVDVADQLEAFKPFRAVYGNIDGGELRKRYPEHLDFEIDGLKVWITHIGGYPNRYPKRIKEGLLLRQPNLFICGHSHILKVIPDSKHQLLHMNPGACGLEGWHKVKTLLRFSISKGKITQLEVVELGPRAQLV